ncbi:hypothetical protein [Streptomyces sp. V17-9]|uniref:hypothetical protein n=1 Tax=Streptomyces sp. V17-9 TaxID=2831149 RepID=UPI001BEFA168|nr:hypothetical protein [Streptomyces sp. V17-9]QUW91045.1 hypothetical protein KE639_02237 [Streptomyces sp. V17-9]
MSDTTDEPGTVPGRDVHAERGDVHADRGHFNTERGADSGPGTSTGSATTADARTTAGPGTAAGRGTTADPRTTTDPGTAAAPRSAAALGAPAAPGTGAAPGTAAAPGAAADAGPDGITPAPAPSETAAPQAPPAADRPLLPPTDSDRLGERLHHALAGFVDAPRASVEEADRVLEEITARFTEAVTHRRQTLRASWREPGEGGGAPSTDTEQLRLALRDYRELAGRLMRL